MKFFSKSYIINIVALGVGFVERMFIMFQDLNPIQKTLISLIEELPFEKVELLLAGENDCFVSVANTDNGDELDSTRLLAVQSIKNATSDVLVLAVVNGCSIMFRIFRFFNPLTYAVILNNSMIDVRILEDDRTEVNVMTGTTKNFSDVVTEEMAAVYVSRFARSVLSMR